VLGIDPTALASGWPALFGAGGVLSLVGLAVWFAFSMRKVTADADARTDRSDDRYEDEAAAHRVTQRMLDEERERRRRIEDELSAQVRELRSEVAKLRAQVQILTGRGGAT
jgi:uncharacterized coiled-coil protein SlyX